MKDAKHTPGPWEYDEESGMVFLSKRNADGYRYGIVQSSGELVPTAPMCDFYWSDIEHGSADEVRANCRLIAAAPELLEILKNALAALILYKVNPVDNRYGPLREKIIAVIQKAEGTR